MSTHSHRRVIQVFEHQTLKLGFENKFLKYHFKELERYGYETSEKYFTVGNNRVKFSNYVGVIQVKDLTIEVLPKADTSKVPQSKEIWHNALLGMLAECKLIKLHSIREAKLRLRSSSILDLYYDAFLAETEKLVREGLRKSYKNVIENLGKVKGKIIFGAHVRKNYVHRERFLVEHKVFNVDYKLNQILLKALSILSKVSSNSRYGSRIKKLLLNFENVADVNVPKTWFDSLSFDRNTERYKSAISLAKLIILKYSPDLRGGSENVLAILFDMNKLFENYIYRKLKVLERDPNIPITKVSEQPRRPFWGSHGVKADILIEKPNGICVIDTKWKILTKYRPSDRDVQQMFIYDLHYDSPLAILLYPKTTFDNSDRIPFRKREFEALHCQIGFTDIFDSSGELDRELGYKLYQELLEK